MRLVIDTSLKAANASTQYVDYDFNSMVNFNGRPLGVKSDGLFELLGDFDDSAAIQAYFEPTLSDLGDASPKRMRSLDMTLRGGPLDAIVTSESGEQTIEFTGTDSFSPARQRRIVSRGVYGSYWKYHIENKNGSDFLIDSMSGVFIIQNRGLRP